MNPCQITRGWMVQGLHLLKAGKVNKRKEVCVWASVKVRQAICVTEAGSGNKRIALILNLLSAKRKVSVKLTGKEITLETEKKLIESYGL